MSGIEMSGGEPGGSVEMTGGQLTPPWLESLIDGIIHPEPEPELEL
jgi:hypothetical protein